MAGIKSVFVCSECGHQVSKWMGKCPSCDSWDTLSEEIVEKSSSASSKRRAISDKPVRVSEIQSEREFRYKTGLGELDRVLGGGIVKGSLILVGGDPGIGKSTVLLQICEYLGKNMSILYVTGEESAGQIKLRAVRLGVHSDNLFILAQTDTEIITETIRETAPDIVIIDSIQTMCIRELTSSPGSVVQVRECTNAIMRVAKNLDIPVFLVGHVNKDGAIAGPKVLEHIVDVVLHFEGDKQMSYRILRAVKNRYGSTNEIGVFEMCDDGLHEVENPSLMLLSGRPVLASGSSVVCVMEGSRPILAEIQGLAAPSGFENPRRMATGFDYNRMALLIAVLEKRSGVIFSRSDAYVNVVGGLKLDEPAVDLAVAMALISSLRDIVIGDDVMMFGEIGLAGELRAVSNAELRIMEGQRMGFKTCILPMHNLDVLKKKDFGIKLIGVNTVREAMMLI
ncbi:MAG: DNA repair protein RadA [Oscillospiraceae bacterium]|nr:DNA repair protein RadA [Oscillospiraceae bacterium]